MIGKIKHYIKLFFTAAGKWRYARLAAAGLILLSAIIPVLDIVINTQAYALSPAEKSLVGTPNSNLTAKLQYDSKERAWLFNNLEKPASKDDIAEMLRAQVGGGGKNDTTLYSAKVSEDARKGITYTDNESHLSFTLKPQFKKGGGKLVDNRLIYPMADGAKAVYTIKSNGLKEDIILDKNIGDELTYTYKLDLPKELTAKLQADGTVGIYSVSPLLYTAKASGDMDAAKLKNARETAPKDYLAFGLPAPVIIDSKGKHVPGKFSLIGDTLTVHARSLAKLSYPLTIDPSVVITSSSDFTSGNDEGMISYGTADQITRSGITGGTVGNWTTTTAMEKTYEKLTTVAYNGYMYRMGGYKRSPTGTYNTIYYAPANSNGTLGSWTNTTDLPVAYESPSVAVYNGYMYLIGGNVYNGSPQTVATTYYSKIGSDGTLGSWTTTTALPEVMANHSVVATGGYIYTLGGATINGGNCGTNNDCLDVVYYAPLHADGTIGNWNTTTSLTSVRATTGATAYNGYMYIGGGGNTGYLNDVQYARINNNGTLGSWVNAPPLPNARYGHQFAAYNGYMYMYSGRGSSWYNDVRYAQINADGSLGSWATTTAFSTGRAYGGGTIYNGYLYIMGGYNGSSNFDDVQYAKIDNPGTTTPYTTSGNTLGGGARRGAATVAYGSYLYSIGGDQGFSATSTVYRAPINSDGTIGSFGTTTAIPAVRAYAAAVGYNGRLYVIGGCSSTYANCGTAGNATSTVYSAAIDPSNGNVSGSWRTETGTITTARYGLSAAVYNNTIYLMGGLNGGTFNNTIHSHAINTTDGTITGAWSNTTRTLPTSMAYMASTIYGGVLYVAGGCSAGALTCTTTRDQVHYAAINNNGSLAGSGALTQSGTFSTARGDFGMTAVNNNLYITGGRTNNTYYSDTQVAPINSNGTVGSWTAISGTTLATARAGAGVVSTNGNIYAVSGYNGSTLYDTVQIAGVNNGGGGQAGSWTTDSTDTFTGGRTEAQTVAHNGYLYVLGGRNGSSYLNTVQFAPLNTDGTVGAWVAGPNFTTGRSVFSATAMNGYMYILGGRNGASTYLKDIQYAKINADGSLGAWASAGSNVFNAGQGSCVVAYNGYIYSLGGWDGSTDHNSVRYAQQNAGGTIGSWQTANSFTDGRSNLNCVTNGGYIYISGGENLVGTNDVQYAQINGNGSLGTWAYTTGYNLGRVNHAMFTYNGFMYIAGGQGSTGGGSDRNDMQYAPINSNGTVGAWQHTSPIDNSSAMDMAVYNGYVYAPSQVTGSTSTRYAKLDSIARKGMYSKLVDLGLPALLTGVTYSGTLPGGNLQINYRTASDDGVFGSLKNVQYPGLADACTGIYGAARYVWLSIALDDSERSAFGDGGPANLTDISLVYSPMHPDPQYRLHGGKSLIAGVKSPLDTCGS